MDLGNSEDEFQILQAEEPCNGVFNLNKRLKNEDNVVLYVNVRSLNANYEKLEIMINCLTTKPLVIVCTETWNLEFADYYHLDNYQIFYNNSKLNKADGVAIYVHNSLDASITIKEIGRLRILCTRLKKADGKGINVEISAVYRSHCIEKLEFIDNVKKYLESCNNNTSQLVIGDFNIDIMENSLASQEFLSNFLEKDFIPCFNEITRPSVKGNSGTCIDNIFIRTETLEYNAIKLTNTSTDHYPLILALKNVPSAVDHDKINHFLNYKKLNKIAKQIIWNDLIINDVNMSTDLIIHEIKNLYAWPLTK